MAVCPPPTPDGRLALSRNAPHPGRRVWLRSAGALLAGSALAATAQGLDPPSGPVVLSLVGQVQATNRSQRADFDMAMLERLPQSSFRTRTPWYDGARKFTGPLLRDVLAAARAKGSTLRAVALNDYRVDLPFDDALKHDVIVARLMDDQPMPVREKGPLFLIYPFDSQPDLRNVIYYSRSAWQLRSIEVR